MSEPTTTAHEKYYVPEKSSMAILATIGLITSTFGAATAMNQLTFGEGEASFTIMYVGLCIFAATLFSWFRTTIKENIAGLNSAQLKKSYVMGMFWFIFSEVMFFAAFFGALFYVRTLAGPWLAGEGEGGAWNHLLWEGFEFSWPMALTPQEAIGGVGNQIMANNGTFTSAHKSMAFSEASAWYLWLPLLNTIILLTSSGTVHIAHEGLLSGNRKRFNTWLVITVLLGIIFISLQIFGVLRGLRTFRVNTELWRLWFHLLHVDRVSRFPRCDGHHDVSNSMAALCSRRSFYCRRPLWLRSVFMVLALC